MPTMRLTRGSVDGQRGSVLVVSLIFLLLLTLLGLAALQTTTLEEKMAGNVTDQSRAFQAAEAALRNAEAEIDTASFLTPSRFASIYTGAATDPDDMRRAVGVEGFNATCTGTANLGGLCSAPLADKVAQLTGANTGYTQYGAASAAPAIAGVAAQPRYLIEFSCQPGLSGSGKCQYSYVITAIGFGARMSSRAIVEGRYRGN